MFPPSDLPSPPPDSREPPIATIVVACYNHDRFLRRALESAFGQDFPSFEVIITDDASTDNSQDTIRRLLAENQWTARTIMHDRNKGLCTTFNEALELVRSPFVAFISADDWADPSRLRRQIAVLESQPDAPFIYGSVILVDDADNRTETQWRDIHGKDWPGEALSDPYRALLMRNFIPAASALSRTDALREVGGFDETLPYEDWDMWLRLTRSNAPAFHDEPLVYYRIHEDSLWRLLSTTDHRADRWLTAARIYRKHVDSGNKAHSELAFKKLRVSARSAWRRGAPSKDVMPLLHVAATRSRHPVDIAYFLLARLGLSGRTVHRIASTIRRCERPAHQLSSTTETR